VSIAQEDRRGARLAELLAARLGYSPAEARQIRIAALLHDIGKQKIPAAIVDKPGRLSRYEFEVMKTHTTRGAEMLAGVQGDIGEKIRAVCLWHHEWDNGGGYWGKSGAEIPAYVPVVSICDVFLALLSKRSYKQAWALGPALDYIQNSAGTQFSRPMTDAFIALIKQEGGILCPPWL
jgi:putative two-component system response regulator